MNRLLVLTDSPLKSKAILAQLGAGFDIDCISPEQMKDRTPNENILVDVSLTNDGLFLELRNWLATKDSSQNLIFLVDQKSAIDSIRSSELGATSIYVRPLDRTAIFTALLGDFDSLLLDASVPPIRSYPAMAPALDALENIFAAARFGAGLDLSSIHQANEVIVDRVRSHGLESWLDVVRRHHSQTYQHSLIVVGVTAAFCRRLGFSSGDHAKLTLGALFHDLGKVHVPVGILEKPAALDAKETIVMRQHPQLGFESLRNATEVGSDILEIVQHHHELLDGSGYPDNLSSSRIRDAVRIVTICDIFGAMIENRSYRKAMSTEAAFAEMRAMGGKLDADLMREFSFVSGLRLAA